MSELGKELIDAIGEAKEEGLVTLTASPNIAELRKRLKMSQKRFSETYRIGIETLRKWEQGKRFPDSISKAYLKCIERDPETMRKLVNA